MWSVASTRSKSSRAQDPDRTGVTFKAMGNAMSGKGEDRAEGLAERSVNTSIVHPSQSSPDHQEQGDGVASNRVLTENQQREGLEKTDPDRPKPDDRYKP